ncbi:ABC transporter permease [Halotalea alkalilenta]|uniref:ABC transporter permease n=1 Tax=Halotalea alkalilenta TaxID=376489 RepID=UPI00048518BF|nr:ABC transporter permease [Halotalea alkalilenta]
MSTSIPDTQAQVAPPSLAAKTPWRTLLGRIDWPLALFLVAWFIAVVVPLLGVVVYSFFETKSFFTVYTPSLNTWASIFDSGRFEVILRTLRIAFTVTAVELVLAFAFSLWLAKGRASRTVKAMTLALMTVPFFLDLSSRTIIWRAILGENGPLIPLLTGIGLVEPGSAGILYSEWAVHFGMIIALFPTMMLPVYIAISLVDDTLIDASNDLGASPWQTLTRVVIPLSLPGVIAGILFTLGSAMAAWVEPSMLGGGFVNLLSNSIESAYSALRYPVLAALTTLIVMILGVLVLAFVLIGRRFGDLSSSFRVLRS